LTAEVPDKALPRQHLPTEAASGRSVPRGPEIGRPIGTSHRHSLIRGRLLIELYTEPARKELLPSPFAIGVVRCQVGARPERCGGFAGHWQRHHQPAPTGCLQVLMHQFGELIDPRSGKVRHNSNRPAKGQFGEPVGDVSGIHRLQPEVPRQRDHRQFRQLLEHHQHEIVKLGRPQRCVRDGRSRG